MNILSYIIIIILILLQLSLLINGFNNNMKYNSKYRYSNNNMKCNAMIELQTGQFDKEVLKRY